MTLKKMAFTLIEMRRHWEMRGADVVLYDLCKDVRITLAALMRRDCKKGRVEVGRSVTPL